jgi:hypothetical protein
MSKAFTKETDSDDEELALPPLPIGGKNYITPSGYARLKAELLDLIDNERPKVTGPPAMAIGPRTVTTFTAKNVCVKLTAEFAS